MKLPKHVFFFALFVTVALSGCKPDVGAKVWLIGDSLLFEMTALPLTVGPNINSQLKMRQAPPSVEIEPFTGYKLVDPYWASRLNNLRNRNGAPDILFVVLGSNDIIDETVTLEQISAGIDAIMSFADNTEIQVYWMLPPGGQEPRRSMVRDLITTKAGEYTNLNLLEVDPQLRDGLHLTDAGTNTAILAMKNVVDTLFPPPVGDG